MDPQSILSTKSARVQIRRFLGRPAMDLQSILSTKSAPRPDPQISRQPRNGSAVYPQHKVRPAARSADFWAAPQRIRSLSSKYAPCPDPQISRPPRNGSAVYPQHKVRPRPDPQISGQPRNGSAVYPQHKVHPAARSADFWAAPQRIWSIS